MERWLPPHAFVLGVALSALVLAFLFLPFYACFVLLLRWCSLFCLRLLVGALRLFLFVLSCSCLLLVLMSWGGLLARVVMYVAVSVSSLLLRSASKKAREVLPCAMHAGFFFSCPVLLLLVHMFLFGAFLCWCTRTHGDGDL